MQQTLPATLNITRYVAIGYIAAPYLVWLRYGELAFRMAWDHDMFLATTLISVRRLLASQRPILSLSGLPLWQYTSYRQNHGGYRSVPEPGYVTLFTCRLVCMDDISSRYATAMNPGQMAEYSRRIICY